MAPSSEKRFGLLGRNIAYSFSRGYFAKKFEAPQWQHCRYDNYDLPEAAQIKPLLQTQPYLNGLNVTVPYKEAVIPFLDDLDPIAQQIGAVNTIQWLPDGTTLGYNTDWYGFQQALAPHLAPHHQRALILGTGGAAKAIRYTLQHLGIPYTLISRSGEAGTLSYAEITPDIMHAHTLVIQCTPLGTFPEVEACPPLPYSHFTPLHLAFDLVYNPSKTRFLTLAEAQGADIENGYSMLVHQAEKAWEIWNSTNV